MTKKQTYGLALLSAFMLWLAWPPIPYTTPLLLVALVPLLLALDQVKKLAERRHGKQIFLTAGLTFLVWNTACIYWVYNAVSYGNSVIVSLLICLIPFCLGALLMTFAFWLYYRLSLYTTKKVAYLGLVSFWIAMEFLHQSWDLAFPWMNLGNGLAGMHQLAQWYEYTGVYGGSVWILLSNILAYEAWLAFKKQKDYAGIRPALIWLAFIVVPSVYSVTRYFRYKEKSVPMNVVTVQPNIDPYKKYGSVSTPEQMDILTHLSDSVGQVNTEYFIWPETALPTYTNEEKIRSSAEFIAIQQFISKYKNGAVLTGIESVRTYNERKTLSAKKDASTGIWYDNFNAAMQVENSANVPFYHKSKLVPGVEKMPFPEALAFLAPVFDQLGGSTGGWGWQEDPTVFYAQSGAGVDPVICYESIWGDWVRRSVKDGAQFVAIITNDGWWGNTSGKDQHIMYAKLRAIENRRWVVRSANTGISGFINQRGDITKESKWWTRTALKADINLSDDITFYTQNGDIIPWLLSITAFFLALFIPYKRWTSKEKPVRA